MVHDFLFFIFSKEKGDFRPKGQRVKIGYEKSRNIYEVNQGTERKRESWKPEMESTNSPLMKSLLNLMVGILTKDSKLSLQWLSISRLWSRACSFSLGFLSYMQHTLYIGTKTVYVKESTKYCRCTKFLHRMGHVLIHGRAKHGLSLCVWGMLSPKLYTRCGRPLDGWWCISF